MANVSLASYYAYNFPRDHGRRGHFANATFLLIIGAVFLGAINGENASPEVSESYLLTGAAFNEEFPASFKEAAMGEEAEDIQGHLDGKQADEVPVERPDLGKSTQEGLSRAAFAMDDVVQEEPWAEDVVQEEPWDDDRRHTPKQEVVQSSADESESSKMPEDENEEIEDKLSSHPEPTKLITVPNFAKAATAHTATRTTVPMATVAEDEAMRNGTFLEDPFFDWKKAHLFPSCSNWVLMDGTRYCAHSGQDFLQQPPDVWNEANSRFKPEHSEAREESQTRTGGTMHFHKITTTSVSHLKLKADKTHKLRHRRTFTPNRSGMGDVHLTPLGSQHWHSRSIQGESPVVGISALPLEEEGPARDKEEGPARDKAALHGYERSATTELEQDWSVGGEDILVQNTTGSDQEKEEKQEGCAADVDIAFEAKLPTMDKKVFSFSTKSGPGELIFPGSAPLVMSYSACVTNGGYSLQALGSGQMFGMPMQVVLMASGKGKAWSFAIVFRMQEATFMNRIAFLKHLSSIDALPMIRTGSHIVLSSDTANKLKTAAEVRLKAVPEQLKKVIMDNARPGCVFPPGEIYSEFRGILNPLNQLHLHSKVTVVSIYGRASLSKDAFEFFIDTTGK